jgi:predicted nucleic acid-binding protein
MNIVVDTNILISLLIKPTGVTFDLFNLLSSFHHLYISDYTLTEMSKHNNRIVKASKISVSQFENLKAIALKNVSIFPAHFITDEILTAAYLQVKDIDENDAVFLATAIF